MARVIVCCGGGVATSSIVMYELEMLLKENDIQVPLYQCAITELPTAVDSADLIITTVKLYTEYKIPVIHAIGLLTGNNIEETKNLILDELKKIL